MEMERLWHVRKSYTQVLVAYVIVTAITVMLSCWSLALSWVKRIQWKLNRLRLHAGWGYRADKNFVKSHVLTRRSVVDRVYAKRIMRQASCSPEKLKERRIFCW